MQKFSVLFGVHLGLLFVEDLDRDRLSRPVDDLNTCAILEASHAVKDGKEGRAAYLRVDAVVDTRRVLEEETARSPHRTVARVHVRVRVERYEELSGVRLVLLRGLEGESVLPLIICAASDVRLPPRSAPVALEARAVLFQLSLRR